MANSPAPVAVSRRIEAPADRIFAVLADPRRHRELDGADMLRGCDDKPVTAAGDTFLMNMYFDGMGGPYQMLNHVVAFEPDRRIAWRPSPGDEAAAQGGFPIGVPAGHQWTFDLVPDGPDATVVTESYNCSDAPKELQDVVDQGRQWIPAMTATLARLDEVCGS